MCKSNKDVVEKFDYDTTSVHVARLVGKVRTYLDIFNELIKKDPKNKNDFLSLIINALYDLIIIETYKLIDKNESSISLFHLMAEVIKCEELNLEQKKQVLKKKADLEKIFTQKCAVKIHRNKLKAHSSNESNLDIRRFIDLNEIYAVLNISEELVRQYNLWVKGDRYSIDFSSVYAGGHKSILEYISSLKF